EHSAALAERPVFQPLWTALVGFNQPLFYDRIRDGFAACGGEIKRYRDHHLHKGSIATYTVVEIRQRRFHMKHGGQVWRTHGRRGLLHRGQIRKAGGADLSIGPGLLRDPLDRVVAIFALVNAMVKMSRRLVASAHVLNHNDITAASEVLRIEKENSQTRVFVVASANQDDRKLARNYLASLGWMIHIRDEIRSIAHGDLDIALNIDLVLLLGFLRCICLAASNHKRHRDLQQQQNGATAQDTTIPAHGSP